MMKTTLPPPPLPPPPLHLSCSFGCLSGISPFSTTYVRGGGREKNRVRSVPSGSGIHFHNGTTEKKRSGD